MNVPTLRTTSPIEDTEETIINAIEFEKGDIVLFLGYDIDRNNTIISIIAILIGIFLWHYTGLLKLVFKSNFLFFLFIAMILFLVFQIFSTSYLSGNITLEYSKLVSVSQTISSLLSSFLILMYISSQFIKDKSKREIIFNMYVIIIVLLLIQTRVNVKPSGEYIKAVRLVKETIFNIVVFTIIGHLYLVVKNFS